MLRRSEEFAPVRGDSEQYRYPVLATRTLYGMTGALSTREDTFTMLAE